MRARREASLSCRGHAICLIDFHDIDKSKESHGGCDRRLVLAERRFGCVEDSKQRLCVRCWGLAAAALARGSGSTGGLRSGGTKYRAMMFRVKAQGLAFIGCTWQWPC